MSEIEEENDFIYGFVKEENSEQMDGLFNELLNSRKYFMETPKHSQTKKNIWKLVESIMIY